MDDLQTFLNIREILVKFLQEDVGAGDITSDNIIRADMEAKAEIVCKSRFAIVCGLEEASMLFDICGCKSEILVKDGSKVVKGAVVMNVSGYARAILKAERTVLNIIMRMSGIATETRRMVDLAKGVTILATRKTAPGLRYFDKKAVVLGGGATHRMRLDDMVLIKDNHLVLVSDLGKCIRLAKKNVGSSIKVECEVRTKEEALAAVAAEADTVMLDNFTPKQAQQTIRQIRRMGLRNKVKIELSGGINQNNIRQYSRTKPDFISLGYITHSSKTIDFSLEIMK
ncbi:MAG TPA: carboxylating nicotinate-nucleotide diphosphorylase [Nitrososphaera sp.]|jgi:nicotinate-nucleotide pyrophosphorylase (carboxylating)|nr:carboxylating nicotinate-nucleotide diphosphorylase [Nitrososphaera sp.]